MTAVVPIPAVVKFSLPGLALALAIRSAQALMSESLRTT